MIFVIGFWLQRQLTKKIRSKFALSQVDSRKIGESEKRTLNQIAFDDKRFHGLIGDLYITERKLIIEFLAFSPAKLFWGFKTAGIEIQRSQVTKVSDELGVCLEGHTFSFSKEDHEAIQTCWSHETEPVAVVNASAAVGKPENHLHD